MDVHWRYADPERDHVDSREVRDQLAATFDDFVSESIQHLVHEMGTRMLDRWPQIAEIRFEAENHTRDPAGEDGARKIYTDPFPAQGLITLTLERGERPAHHARARHRARTARGRRRGSSWRASTATPARR